MRKTFDEVMTAMTERNPVVKLACLQSIIPAVLDAASPSNALLPSHTRVTEMSLGDGLVRACTGRLLGVLLDLFDADPSRDLALIGLVQFLDQMLHHHSAKDLWTHPNFADGLRASLVRPRVYLRMLTVLILVESRHN